MGRFISDHVLDQIRQSNDLVEVIGAAFPLKRKGSGFWALCPFHKEKTPSFHVNPQRQIWHCFGCGAGGDVFGFVMKYEGLDFMEAVRRLAERAGVRLETELQAAGPSRSEKELLYKLHEEVAAFYHANLMKQPANGPGKAYLAQRQIGKDTVKHWRLGYAPDAWDGLLDWARSKKYPPQLLETAGLVLAKESAEGYYDRFRGRLMFPICDEQGRVVGFSGRILTDEKDQPKYINSPETSIFHKGRVLYGLHHAKRAILDERFVIIAEGQIDTISCHEAGLTNTVAPQGTALTEQHARILKRYADEVVLMFDSDEAGQQATQRSAESLLAAGLVIRVASLPVGHDPDSLVKASGPEALKNVVTTARPFFVYLLERLSQQFDPRSDRGRLQIAQGAMTYVAQVGNAILRASYVRQIAERLNIPEVAVREELRKVKQRGKNGVAAADSAAERETTRVQEPPAKPAEALLLQLMLADDRAIALAAKELDRQWLTTGMCSELIMHVLGLYESGTWNGPTSLLNRAQDESAGRLVAELLDKPLPAADVISAVRDCLGALERDWIERQMQQIRRELAQIRSGPKMLELLQRHQQLDSRRRQVHIAVLPV